MKTLDRLLLTSFIPPFFMTFFIAIFVLIMQFLWTYVDDIIGKGVEISVRHRVGMTPALPQPASLRRPKAPEATEAACRPEAATAEVKLLQPRSALPRPRPAPTASSLRGASQ